MSIGTKIYTWIYGNYVGSDELENKYYCNSKDFNNINYKRWVIFKGEIEASKIPPHWHAWLHKSIDKPPINYTHEYDWQKNHQPNYTGTSKAYYPISHPLSNSSKKTDDSDYEKWQP
tara:strand:+ start:108 stop:458 length:351 start_codon:yes stop_codon:yes gene_type:complete